MFSVVFNKKQSRENTHDTDAGTESQNYFQADANSDSTDRQDERP